MPVQHYRELIVWQKSFEMAVLVYQLTDGFPAKERFGLISQSNRAAGSVPANIAEGQGRNHTREFIQHIGIARGSLNEMETHLLIASRLGFTNEAQLAGVFALATEVGKLLNGLESALRAKLVNS